MYQYLPSKTKLINSVMLVLMLSYQLVVPDVALGGRRWWCRHHSCYHNYGYHCNHYPNYGCDHHNDDFFVRVNNELRYDATLAVIAQNASNQLANLALVQGRLPQQAPQYAPAVQAAPAPVQLPQYQQPYQQSYQQPYQQQIPQPVPQQYQQQYVPQQQPMNYVPQVGVQQQQQAPQPFQNQQPQYYQPGQPQAQQPIQQPGQQQPPFNMGDPFPQQTPGLSGDQQAGQQPGQTQPDPSLDVNTYLTGLKSAYIQIVTSQSSTCYRCHSAEKFATDGGNIDLSDINKIDSNLAEKIFFEVYTGNMPKGGPPLQKVQYDILSDYAFLLKNYPQSQVSQPQVNQSVPVSPPQ